MIREQRRLLLEEVFRRLIDTFGPQHWWPADSKFEMIIGAILTQNTNWKNVEKVIDQLKRNNLLDVNMIVAVDETSLKSLIRSAGYYNQKARRLRIFCQHIIDRWNGDLERFLGQDLDTLRTELLSIHGIGPETADSIVLYAANQPSFVVDAYTHRIFSRHGWIADIIDYDELRNYFMDSLPPDVAFFQEFHALLVKVGKLFCRRKPLCKECPLEFMLENPGLYTDSRDATSAS